MLASLANISEYIPNLLGHPVELLFEFRRENSKCIMLDLKRPSYPILCKTTSLTSLISENNYLWPICLASWRSPPLIMHLSNLRGLSWYPERFKMCVSVHFCERYQVSTQETVITFFDKWQTSSSKRNGDLQYWSSNCACRQACCLHLQQWDQWS